MRFAKYESLLMQFGILALIRDGNILQEYNDSRVRSHISRLMLGAFHLSLFLKIRNTNISFIVFSRSRQAASDIRTIIRVESFLREKRIRAED